MVISRDVISEETCFELFSIQLFIFILLYSMTCPLITKFILMKIKLFFLNLPNYTMAKTFFIVCLFSTTYRIFFNDQLCFLNKFNVSFMFSLSHLPFCLHTFFLQIFHYHNFIGKQRCKYKNNVVSI